MTKHLIEINNLTFKYENNIILNDVSFDITQNENIGILGRNGGGKSTLIKILLGFIKPVSGSVKYNYVNLMLLSLFPCMILLFRVLQIKKIYSENLAGRKKKLLLILWKNSAYQN